MYKEILRTIAGIEVYPILSLLLFVGVFAVVLVRVSRLDRGRLRQLAALPLESSEPRGTAGQDADEGNAHEVECHSRGRRS